MSYVNGHTILAGYRIQASLKTLKELSGHFIMVPQYIMNLLIL